MTPNPHTDIVYLAGPMRGYPSYNFPAFDFARSKLRTAGYAVMCPADMDRRHGFNPDTDEATAEFMAQAARRDIAAIARATFVAVLPGWRKSAGVRAELTAARFIGLPVLSAEELTLDIVSDVSGEVDAWLDDVDPGPTDGTAYSVTSVDGLRYHLYDIPDKAAPVEEPAPTTTSARRRLLDEAATIVDGDRNAQYGDPRQDFARTATMWGAYLGVDVAPHDVAALMACLKVSRIRWSPDKRDSWLDLAGYAACGWDCIE